MGRKEENGMIERIDDVAGMAIAKAKYLGFKAKEKFVDFVTKEDGDVNVVSIVILIGIAVVLALLFKTQITSIVTNLLNNIKTKSEEAMK